MHRYMRFQVVSCQEEPLLGLSACEHLGLLYRVASLRGDYAQVEPILEGAGMPDTKVQQDPVAAQYEDVLRELDISSLIHTRLQSKRMLHHMQSQHRDESHCHTTKRSRMK